MSVIGMLLNNEPVEKILLQLFYAEVIDYIRRDRYDWANHPEYVSAQLKQVVREGDSWLAVVDVYYRGNKPDHTDLRISLAEVFEYECIEVGQFIERIKDLLPTAQSSG